MRRHGNARSTQGAVMEHGPHFRRVLPLNTLSVRRRHSPARPPRFPQRWRAGAAAPASALGAQDIGSKAPVRALARMAPLRAYRYAMHMLAFVRSAGWCLALVTIPIAARAQSPGDGLSRAEVAAYSTAIPAADPAYARARFAFAKAYDRIGTAKASVPAHDAAILRAYPLYRYLEAARIEHALLTAPDSPASVDREAAALIARHRGEPVARELRTAWLASLARRSQWETFLQAYSPSDATPALRCQDFAARIALGKTSGLEQAIEKAWLTPQHLPECKQAFNWLRRRGALTPERIAQRARLVLEAADPAFARQIIAQLPKGPTARSLRLWASLLEHPRAGIDALIAAPDRSVDDKALLAGWSLLARTHPRMAKRLYWRLVLSHGLTRRGASPFALALALGLAWDRDPAALGFFRRVEPHDFTVAAREWEVRAALWSLRWRLALRSITALPRDDRNTSRWRYWTARAEAALRHRRRARRVYRSILNSDDYYAALAAARLRRDIEPHPRALPIEPEVVDSLARIPAVVRARELFFCGLERKADAEWRYAYGSLSAKERTEAILLAARWGWYTQAIETAADQHVFDDYPLLYPRPYHSEVRRAARRADLDPALVLGVIRQESLYQADAVSPVGAVGLMQLMPGTATRTARTWGMPDPDDAELFDPSINISLGSAHLRTLLNRFAGRVPLAIAAYNAGTRAVLRLLPAKAVPGDVWIENIPYDETREYVERVLWHSVLFSWLTDGTAPSTGAWLAPLGRAALSKALETRTVHARGAGLSG